MVETAEAICGGLHLSTDVRITPFSALIPSLLANKIDIIAAALLRTPERERIVGFSDPVFHYSGALVVHREDRRPFPNLAAARDLRVGGQVGTRFIEQLREAGVTQVSTYESISDMLRDLDHGRLDAAYGDDPIIRYQLRVGPRRNAMIAEGFVAPAREELCLVLRRGDPLLPSVNTVIARLGKSVIPSINRRWGLTA
jgi:polar amino acid transport system substrate-binding protein